MVVEETLLDLRELDVVIDATSVADLDALDCDVSLPVGEELGISAVCSWITTIQRQLIIARCRFNTYGSMGKKK